MIYVLYAIHVVVCIFLILVVLLQQGKGADLSVFGGGSTQTAFGARSATTLLHKLTVTSFVLFIFTTLGIGIMQGGPGRATLMSDVLGGEIAGEEAATDQEAQAPADEAATDQGAPTQDPAQDKGAAAQGQAATDEAPSGQQDGGE